VGSTGTLLGIGAISLDSGLEPELLVVADGFSDELAAY
jgi:hypothetical protein